MKGKSAEPQNPVKETTPLDTQTLEFDDLLTKHVGAFGRRQKLLVFLLSLGQASQCMHVLAPVFLAGETRGLFCEAGSRKSCVNHKP